MDVNETYMGKVYGLRAYNLIPGKYFLGGYSTRWYSPRQKAHCNLGTNKHFRIKGQRRSTAPCGVFGHHCGINAFRIDKFNEEMLLTLTQYGLFIGVAELWGTIVVGSNGYRAEQARIVRLYEDERVYVVGANGIPQGWKQVPIINVSFRNVDDIAFDMMAQGYMENHMVQIPKEEA